MSKLYKILLAISIVSSISFTASSQDYWSARTDRSGITTDKAVSRLSFPTEFKLFSLNITPLRQELFKVVATNGSRAQSSTVISLPRPDGQVEQFEVFEASNFDPALQARFPEIRAFSGRSLTDGATTLKLSISPQGIQTMVFRAGGPSEYIEPYSQDHSVYAVFHSQRSKGALPWVCSTPDQQLATNLNAAVNNRIESNAGQLKTMRLAQSCNGEYANYFGATNSSQVALVLAAYNATLTRCNGCYEKDLAIHLNLIATTDQVIYYNPATDPYTTLGAWNGQLQATLTAVIGEANYDIGHMFGASGGGGNAGCIGCVCVDGQKGSGITSPADGIPMGDNFDIDYVAHEVGHQMGGNHSFSFSSEGPGPAQKEVGSGITIMGYAGITNQDVAPHSIDIFHEANISQIQANMAGKTCPITTSLTGINATPVVAAVSNYTIPITTPFQLTGSATDADPADVLTYCWEQNDNLAAGGTGANSVASPTKAAGPNWLSFTHTTNPTRTFPILATILGGNSVTGPLPGGDAGANIEALSSVARTLNFRLTVRDNRPYNGTAVGQTAFTDMAVTVSAAVGPFLVTSQNSAVSYTGGSSQTVTWSVNGTTGAPTNTANVRILWSPNGGLTFPTVLLASTPNDGSESVTMPAAITSEGRIKIEAIGNIYFDINNANISITPPPAGFSFNSPGPVTSSCPTPPTMSTTLTATYSGGHSANIALSATATGGATVTLTPSTLTTVTTSTTVTVTNASSLAPGTYTVTVTGVSAPAPNQSVNIDFIIVPAVGPTITTQPTTQTVCVGSTATFTSASPAATSFQWQLNSGSGFGNIAGATSANYTTPATTAGMNNYQYRVIASTACGSTTSSTATLLVNTSASITGQPADLTICEGANTSFSVTATTAIGTILYQWQVSTDNGATWTDLAGQTNSTFNQTGVLKGQNGYRFRVVVTTGCGSINSANARLTVNEYPKFEILGLPMALCVSDPSFALTATLAGGVWSGTGVVAGNFVPKTAGLGIKTITYTATNAGCVTAKSSVIQVDECPDRHRLLPNKEAIKLYPNPNTGNFSLRMNSDLYSKLGVQVVGADGKVYMTKNFENLSFGSVMPMDLTSLAQGTYYLYMYNSENGFVSRGDGVVVFKH